MSSLFFSFLFLSLFLLLSPGQCLVLSFIFSVFSDSKMSVSDHLLHHITQCAVNPLVRLHSILAENKSIEPHSVLLDVAFVPIQDKSIFSCDTHQIV